MRKLKIISKWFILISLILIILAGCKKWVDPGLPVNLLVAPKVYGNDSLANAALNYIYNEIMFTFNLLNGNTTKWAGLYSDELEKANPDKDEPFISNSLKPEEAKIKELWATAYQQIKDANEVLAGVTNSTTLRVETTDQIIGEALFLRSLVYFYLLNLFGDVPLVTGIDFNKNAHMARTPTNKIYQQLVEDLKEAESRLSDTYITRPNYGERARVNKKSVTALLARIYLYQRQWADAEQAATEVIESPLYQLETNVAQTFLITSREAIFQFMPVSKIYNTAEGNIFIPMNGKASITLTEAVMNNFEAQDKRRQWIRPFQAGGAISYSPLKYKVRDKAPTAAYQEYSVVLRLAEQYLIRAEARIMQNKLQAATEDLNVIRMRAGIKELTAFDAAPAAMTAIQAERCRELFAEWGHRWFDLKRWSSNLSFYQSKADEVMNQRKPGTWKSSDLLWPIPQEQILLNTALIQNPGY